MASKKDFKGAANPAFSFISGAGTDSTQQTDNKHNTHTERLTPPTAAEETKSKRLNLLLYPSLLEDLKKIAAMQRTSVNDLINTVLSDYREQEADQIDRYNKTFTE